MTSTTENKTTNKNKTKTYSETQYCENGTTIQSNYATLGYRPKNIEVRE